MVLGGVAGALPAYLVYLLASLVMEGAVPVLLAVIVGLPIFVLVMLAPWWCLGGLMEVFTSSAWTLTYRQLRSAEEAQPAQAPAAEAAGLGPAPAT
jgi:flagellar biosynthesis component FlhA